jgi:hypothetical protein
LPKEPVPPVMSMDWPVRTGCFLGVLPQETVTEIAGMFNTLRETTIHHGFAPIRPEEQNALFFDAGFSFF